MAKIVQTEGRTSSLLECYAEVQPIFCKDTKKIETTIPFNSIFYFPPKDCPSGSHQTIFPQKPTQPNHLCASVKSVGGSSPPEVSVYSVKSVGEYPPPETSVNSVNSVGGLAQTNLEWFCGRNSEGGVGMAGMPYPPTKTPTDCTDVHRLGGYGIPAIPTQPTNYLPTEFTEHTETTGGEEKSVYICEIRGRLLPEGAYLLCWCSRDCCTP